MTNVTQQIPNYVGGISQQPDELKVPGQVRTAKNVLPDVTHGLLKRPGGRLIGGKLNAFNTADSKWFHYYRDEDEQYIGQIKLSDGDLKMWKCDGTADVTVRYKPLDWATDEKYNVGDEVTANNKIYKNLTDTDTASSGTAPSHGSGTAVVGPHTWEYVTTTALREEALKNYLKTRLDADDNEVLTGGTHKPEHLQTLTLNDFTYVTNRNKTAKMAATVEPVRDPEAYIELKKVAYASQYSLNLFDDTNLSTVNTATRITVDPVNIGSSSLLENVGTKIFSISGTPEVQIIDTSTLAANTNKWYRITDGTTTLSVTTSIVNTNDSTNHYWITHKLAQAFRDHADYHKLKFTIGNPSTRDEINNQTYFQSGFRLAFKEGGTQSTLATITRSSTDGGAADQVDGEDVIFEATRAVTGSNDNTNKQNLSFRIATTGQAVPSSFTTTATTYHGRYTTVIDLLYGGEGWNVGDQFEVGMRGCSYIIKIAEISSSKVQANLALVRPEPTSFDTKTVVTAESIIGDIRTAIEADGNFTDANIKQIGNGLHITRSSGVFNISTPVGELINVFTNSVKDVAELPSQCKHGYVVKVANSEAEEDDYYVKFIGEQKADGTYLDGKGVWEECAKPGTKIAYDPATMPIQIVRRDIESDGTVIFVVEPITWENALVGDTDASYGTNPRASFVGQTINKMLFFRNRLVMLSDENVIMSQPGEFFNFWGKSAITSTATDMIDISCSSEYPAIVYDGLQVNAGLILFTKNQQFMLTTDSDVLSPLTAKINAVSSYNFNFNTNPVSLGTTIAFLDNAGKYTRFFEMQSVLREGEVTVLEQSKNISKAFPKDINLIANSRENSTIFFAVRGTNKVYGFRYYTTGEQRLQQSWFEWELSGEIQHLAMLDDALYAVIKNSSTYTMQKFSIKLDDNSHTIVEDATYRVHLDNSKSFAHTNLTYVSNGHYTKFDHTAADFNSSRQLYAVAVSTGSDKDFNGLLTPVTTFDDNGTTKVKIPGNWTTTDNNKAFDVVLGYDFDMEVEFPTIYVGRREGESYRSDIQASLVLQRTKFSLGPSGVYKVTLKRIGKPDYSEVFESVKADTYTANTAGIDGEQVVNIPIYEKNTNLTLLLNSQHPSPATLYSMNWEGNYSDRYYKRV